MVKPFVFSDESSGEVSALGKRTMVLQFIISVMNGPNVPFEVIVASERHTVSAVPLWAE